MEFYSLKNLDTDFGFGAVLGIIRGYIIFVLIIFFINTNFSVKSLSIVNNSAFQGIVNYELTFRAYAKKIEKINDIESNMRSLNCLITGASSGIGKSIAIELSKIAKHIYIVSRDVQKLEKESEIVKNECDCISSLIL